ncbi:MAG: RNA-binding domain-containing protein [Caulobacteraceae bacterium]
MTTVVRERSFEEAIEAGLTRGGHAAPGMEAPAFGEPLPYRSRDPSKYDRTLGLLPEDVIDFVLATQPKAWGRLKEHHGAEVRERFLRRLASELVARGALDVLRRGVKDSGVRIDLAYFRPASGLNEETARLHAGNLFGVVRQLPYSVKDESTLDLGLFVNGVPIFTAELKSPLNGQDVQDAIRQYREDRDPREPLLAARRCLAHFAVDPELVYVASELAGPATRFLPFNKGRFGGAGNPPAPPTGGYATAYLWEETWAPESVLDLVRQFVQEIEEEDGRGRKTGKKRLIFPRYQQIDCVRRLVADARAKGAGRRYLIQHSAGSGKTFTIAWLAHRLTTLHDAFDRKAFDSIVVVTDRRILDKQLQAAMRQFEQVLGVVENVDTTSRQLKEALEAGNQIVVTTLQKFPVIAGEISRLPGRRFAVILDEAHSSQSGESSRTLNAVLAARTLEEAAEAEERAPTAEDELEDRISEAAKEWGALSHVSTFAFTATPKPKTLEIFGTPRADGKFEPFHLYSMRQAIEEDFILDVLENYTTYEVYWRLLKTIEDDPRYDKSKARYLLKSFVSLHPHAIGEKARLMVEHFVATAQNEIAGQAKAMIVTRSRLHAVRYRLAIDKELSGKGVPFNALVAFSGTVRDGGKDYTEANMNGFPEGQTAKTFEGPDYRFLIVANKFQTGFDQPLLQTMYVDKVLGGVNAVQTLSRLNRTHPQKKGATVIDFANEAEAIRCAFQDYYETTLLSEGTDPNLLYQMQRALLDFDVYTEPEVIAFAALYFGRASMDQLYAALGPVVARFRALADKEKVRFRDLITRYRRLYAFLAQILPFADRDLEALYQFARYLRRLIPPEGSSLPVEVQRNIDMESYRLQQTSSGKIGLERKAGILDPAGAGPAIAASEEEMEALSRIIAELNERFGLQLGPEHRVALAEMIERLDEDPALDAAARANTRENVRLTFDHKVESVIQQIVDSNFDLYKRITDDHAFGDALKTFLFDHYLRGHRDAAELIKRGESKTLEFKSTLRWNLKEDRRDDVHVTHAALKTIAGFLNTDGGDLLIGVADDGKVVGIEADRLESDDKFMRHLAQGVRNGLGDRAGTCIDPKVQAVNGKAVCVVGCQRSPEPVFLKWKGVEAAAEGDFFVRSGPGTVRLQPESVTKYIRTRFGKSAPEAEAPDFPPGAP